MEELDPHEDYDPYDDAPGIDQPENRLHFDELHPLVQDAVRAAWDERDYHEAVIAAYTAVRNRLRERFGSNADGIDLVEEIYGQGRGKDDPPRLPLTVRSKSRRPLQRERMSAPGVAYVVASESSAGVR